MKGIGALFAAGFGIIIGLVMYNWLNQLVPGLTNPPAAVPTFIKRF